MIIEYSEGADSRVRWNSGGEWKYADIDDLIAAYELRHGKWIKHVDEECEEANWYECPNCHRFKRIATLYCPFCGSKNEGYVWADNCGAMMEEDIRKAYGTKNMLFNCGARMDKEE